MKKKLKHTGYKVPQDYFNTFEDRLFSKIKTASDSQSGFKVPEGYFATLEENVLNKVETQQNTTHKAGKIISLFTPKKVLWAVSIAASVVLVFSLINTKTITNTEITTQDIALYISNNESDFKETDIISYLTDDEINQLTQNNLLVNEQTLEEYLLENIDETSLLTQ